MTRAQTEDLFPETQGQILSQEWVSDAKDKWGHPLVTVRLLSKRDEKEGWQVGWLARAGNALDEWHPNNPDAHKRISGYPWYRLDTLPASATRNVAQALAGRAVKIVLAQMLPFIEPDIHAEVTRIQESVEAQSRAWLQ